MVHPGIEQVMIDEGGQCHPRSRHPQLIGMAAVGVEMGGEDVRLQRISDLGGLEDHGSGAIAVDHRDVPPRRGLVERFGVDLGADHEHPLRRAAADELIGDGGGVDEPAALLADIDGGHPHRDVELRLEEAGGAGKEVIRAQGRQEDHVEVGRPDSGIG